MASSIEPIHHVHGRVADEPCGAHTLGLSIDLGGGPLLEDPALVDDDGAPAERQRLLRFGGGVDDNRARFRQHPAKLDPQLLPKLEIQVDQGLVQEQEIGLLDQRPSQRDALLLATGELRREPIEKLLEMEDLRHSAHPPLDLSAFDPGHQQG